MWARKRNDFLVYYACLWVGGEPSGDISSGRFKPLSTRRREMKNERQRWRERKKAIMYLIGEEKQIKELRILCSQGMNQLA